MIDLRTVRLPLAHHPKAQYEMAPSHTNWQLRASYLAGLFAILLKA